MDSSQVQQATRFVQFPLDRQRQLLRRYAGALLNSRAVLLRMLTDHLASTHPESPCPGPGLTEFHTRRLDSTIRALQDGDFESHYARLAQLGQSCADTDLPFEEIVNSTHIQETAVLPFLRDLAGPEDDLFDLLTAADALYHNELAVLATAYFDCDRQQLVRVNAELRRVSEMRSSFLSSCSHDLRSPLLSITAAARRLLAQSQKPGAKMDPSIVADIRHRAEDLLALVDNLLQLSAAEAGHLAIRPEVIDLRDLVAQQIAGLRYIADERSIVLISPGASEPLLALADPVQLARVLRNVIDNALKFTPEGGRITVGLQKDAEAVRISVEDTGPGIHADDLKTVFDRFTVGAAREGGRHRGTGLGLSVAREIVELHRGNIEVASEPGRGATFTISLPYLPPDAQIGGEI